MPIYDYRCKECDYEWENVEVWKAHKATECPECRSIDIERIIGTPHISMDSDSVRHSLPDPTPPLRELIGKGTEGYKELENEQRELKDYVRRKDRHGNTEWIPKERKYFYGKGEGTSKKEME